MTRRQETTILQTPLGRFMELCVVIAALAVVPLTLGRDLDSPTTLDVVSDWVIWLVFVSEYTVMLVLVDDRRAYVRHHWLSLLVIMMTFPFLPAALSLIGVARLARLARLVRVIRMVSVFAAAARSLKAVLGRPGLMYLAAMTALLVVAAVALMLHFEPQTIQGSVGQGIWWAIVTASTVGYGDISPTTPEGRVVAVVLMFSGIGLVSTFSASIAAHFIGQEDQGEMERLHAKLNEMDHSLVRIELLLESQREAGADRNTNEERMEAAKR